MLKTNKLYKSVVNISSHLFTELMYLPLRVIIFIIFLVISIIVGEEICKKHYVKQVEILGSVVDRKLV